ncbi:MAG: ATP cone domain-containing protein [Rhizonema sp. PD37]|nr:ATP cone domain-containing protein [Rhizonema sp. PD37]
MQAPSTLSLDSTTDIHVVRRDGSTTPLEINKIRTVVNWACRQMQANSIALEAGVTTRLRSGITTREIQDNLIRCALDLCSPEEPDWRYVAGRLHIWSLWKDTKVSRGYQYGQYARTVQAKVLEGQYDRRIKIYTDVELEIASTWINPDWDTDYDYAGAVLLTKRYLLSNELPQEAFLTCALLLASVEAPENRLTWAQKFYEAIARRQISLATPILANLRIPNGTLASCFITAIDDNLESIFGGIHDAARISKNGGGVGVNLSRIRATGSWVMGKANASGGVVPWIKLLNDTAIAVNQGGRRAGAVTVSLDVWHLDLPEFLEMQTENGDQRRKAYDVFPQLVVSDEFMRRVAADTEWTLVDPYEVRTRLGIELAELWGEAFESAYHQIEASLENEIKLYKRVNARLVFKQVMRTQLETGMPYVWFKDTVNRANPNQHEGYIPGGNLCQESWSNVKPGEEAHTCLAAGTKVLTEVGWKAIEECDQQRVLVPFQSDQDFTPVYHFETAKLIDNGIKDVYRLTLKNKRTIEATGNHKFLVRHGSQNRHRQWLTLNEIKIGDRLETQVSEFPLPEFFSVSRNLADAAIGWLIGDGWILDKSIGVCFGSHETLAIEKVVEEMNKIHNATLPHVLAPNKQTPHIRTDIRTGVKSWITNKQSFRDYLDKQYGLNPGKGATKKLTNLIKCLPADRLASILSGLFSADGCVKNPSHKRNCPVIQLSSVSLELLNDVRDCLICFGIHSTINYSYLSSRGTYQGNLNICDWAVDRFMDVISFDLCPDKVQKYHQTQRARKLDKQRYRRTSEVVSIEYIGQAHVYDLNIPKAHHFIAEGIVVHNCNLASINLAQAETEDIKTISQIAVRILDNTIEITSPPFAASATHNAKYRTIGVGFMGLADWLAKRHLTYTHLQEISDLFEDMGYYCTAASMELAKERGAYPAFAGSEWSKGHLIGAKPVDWFKQHASQPERFLQLSEDIKQHGIRNSHITAIAPNTSSSLVQGCTASVLPVYSKFFYEKWAKGTVPIAPPYIRDNLWFYVENKTMDQKKVVRAIAAIQQWIDTGISMELLFNPNAGVYFPDEPERCLTAKDIFETLMLAWTLGCKAIYYIRTVQKDSFKESNEQCVACAS